MSARPALKYFLSAIAVIVAWQFLIKPILRQIKGFDEIEWRGEKYKLKQKYLDYEELKKDDEQLAAQEVERVKRAMLAITVPKSAKSDRDLINSLKDMEFPGFGSTYRGNVKDEKGNRHILFEYEIPQKHEQRTLLYQVESDGRCKLIVDGTSIDHENDHMLADTEVKVENRMLKHLFGGKMYREIPFDPPQ